MHHIYKQEKDHLSIALRYIEIYCDVFENHNANDNDILHTITEYTYCIVELLKGRKCKV